MVFPAGDSSRRNLAVLEGLSKKHARLFLPWTPDSAFNLFSAG